MIRTLGLNGWKRLMSVCASVIILTTGVVAAQNTEGEGASFTEKMKEWQQKMSEVFRDSWQRLW